MTRALVMVAILHYLWLSFGNSFYIRMAKNTHGQPEVFGGVTSTEYGSVLTIGPTARPRTRYSNDPVNVLVDSGDDIIPGFRDRVEEYKALDERRKISTAGGGAIEWHCAGSAPGRRGRQQRNMRRLIKLSCLIVPGLGRNLFSVKQVARNGVESIFDITNPSLETHNHVFPLQELGHDLCSFSLDLAGGGNGQELAMRTAENANLWHRRLGHLNRKGLNLLKNLDNNGVSFDESAMCAPWARVTSWLIARRPITRLNSVSNSFSQT